MLATHGRDGGEGQSKRRFAAFGSQEYGARWHKAETMVRGRDDCRRQRIVAAWPRNPLFPKGLLFYSPQAMSNSS